MATEAIEGIATEEMSESAICGRQVWQQLPIIILNLHTVKELTRAADTSRHVMRTGESHPVAGKGHECVKNPVLERKSHLIASPCNMLYSRKRGSGRKLEAVVASMLNSLDSKRMETGGMVTDPDEMQTQDTSKAYEQVKIEEEKPDSVNCSVGADKREQAESFASCGKTALEDTAISARDLDKIQEGKSKRYAITGFVAASSGHPDDNTDMVISNNQDVIVLKMYSFEHSRCSIPYMGSSFALMAPDRHLEVMF
ncbi:unnamed protein product [Sphagnum compactum]